MSYDGRTFISKENSSNGEVDGRTRFHYRQSGSTVWAHYEGGDIVRGSLLGMADEQGNLHFCITTSMSQVKYAQENVGAVRRDAPTES